MYLEKIMIFNVSTQSGKLKDIYFTYFFEVGTKVF